MEAEVDEDIAAAAAAAAAGFSDDDDEVEQSGEDVYIPDLLWDEYTVCAGTMHRSRTQCIDIADY